MPVSVALLGLLLRYRWLLGGVFLSCGVLAFWGVFPSKVGLWDFVSAKTCLFGVFLWENLLLSQIESAFDAAFLLVSLSFESLSFGYSSRFYTKFMYNPILKQ